MSISYAFYLITMATILLSPVFLALYSLAYYLYLTIADAIDARRAHKKGVAAD